MTDTVMKDPPREPRRVNNNDAQIWGAEMERAMPAMSPEVAAFIRREISSEVRRQMEIHRRRCTRI